MRRAVVATAVAGGLLWGAAPAGALSGDGPTQTGWWSRDPSAAEQPEGGFQVAGVGGQPVSVAAVRFSTPSGVTSATLQLQESGGFVTDAAALHVCRTTAPWEPANPGADEDAPEPDCSAPVAIERDAEALVWSADVASLLPTGGGEASLMIVPSGAGPSGSPVDPGFSVTFSAAALSVVAAPGTTVAPTPTPTPSPAAGGGSSGSSGSGGAVSPGSSGGSFTAPGPATPTTLAPPQTPPTTSSAVEPPAGGEAFQPPALAAGATPGRDGESQPWAKLFFIVPLSAIVGVGVVYAKRALQERGVLDEA